MIKLSIIVPIYGVEQYLRKCVDSLLAQDLPSSEYEIILVEDGSPDKCPQICDDYAAAHKNIRVVHRENGGLSAARNSGIEVAEGEYLMFVDSDDYIEPNVLGSLMEQIETDNLDVLRFRIQNVNENYDVFQPYKRDSRLDNDYSDVPVDGLFFLNSRMNTQCYACQFVLKRDLIIDSPSLSQPSINPSFTPVLFAEGIYFEDIDWTPRMLVKAKKVASTDTVVYNYLIREGSITNAVNRSKQKKVLDDKMQLVKTLKDQATGLAVEEIENRWFYKMIADIVISIITTIAVQFYSERKFYLKQLKDLKIYPIQSRHYKARLINFSSQLAVELLHLKNVKFSKCE